MKPPFEQSRVRLIFRIPGSERILFRILLQTPEFLKSGQLANEAKLTCLTAKLGVEPS